MSGGQFNQYGAPMYRPQSFEDDPYASSPPPPPAHGQRQMPAGMHANSNFQSMQEERRYGSPAQQQSYSDPREMNRSPTMNRRPVGAPAPSQSPNRDLTPSPPMHFGGNMPAYPPPASSREQYAPSISPPRGPSPPREEQYSAYNQQRGPSPPRHDNHYGAAVGGAAVGAGAGMAAGEMMHRNNASTPGNMGQYGQMGAPSEPSEHDYENGGMPYRHNMQSHSSYGSDAPFAGNGGTPGFATPSRSDNYSGYHDYTPSPTRHLNAYQDAHVPTSRSHDQMMSAAAINPLDILDDGGDDFPVHPKRASRVNMAFNKSKSSVNAIPLVGAGAAAVGAGAIGDDMAGGFGKDPNGNYSSIPANRPGALGVEKSGWMDDHSKKSKRWKKIIFLLVGVLIIAGIAAGTVAGVLSNNKADKAASGSSSNSDSSSGDLSKDSAEIQKLMNNPNLHKVFSGFAYTPLGTQYPDCLTTPPDQNNVTRDMAMLSQLTNTVRLYGTDCNQTQMVLHAIDRLELTDMKIWLGVWLGNNDTTNTRQVAQMWEIIDEYGTDAMKGFVIGNEVLFRKDLTSTQLGQYLSDTKSNLTAKNINLPVATSDLGDNWTADMVTEVDVVMSNIHPFFGGVAIDQAAGWTYDFWQSHDVVLTNGMSGKQNIISEFGWPSAGGNDCGDGANCAGSTDGAVAGIDNMNTLMDTWVCQALANGTDYFWFEAFDEPWKIIYDADGANWEDKWGIMDVNRNLKKGLTIPDCGGKTVAS